MKSTINTTTPQPGCRCPRCESMRHWKRQFIARGHRYLDGVQGEEPTEVTS